MTKTMTTQTSASNLVLEYERHKRYFATTLRRLPHMYSKLDTNRMTIIHFAVHALDVMDVWNEDTKEYYHQFQLNKQSLIDWIYQRQVVSADFYYSQQQQQQQQQQSSHCVRVVPDSQVGFLGGTFLGENQDDDENKVFCASCSHPTTSSETANTTTATTKLTISNPKNYYQGHIAMTYTALCTLRTLGDDLSHVDKKGIIHALQYLQRDDGSFQCVHDDSSDETSEHDMRFLYCACAISYMLQDWSGIDIPRAIRFIKSCRSFDGAIALLPGQEGHGGSTFCGVAALVLLNQVSTVLEEAEPQMEMTASNRTTTSTWKDQLIYWCVHRQELGGFSGRPNKNEDTCYSYWIGGTLYLLGLEELLDHSKLYDYIFQCQSLTYGGFSKLIGCPPDVLHSFYSISWLSLSQQSKTSTDTESNNNNHNEQEQSSAHSDNLPFPKLHRLNCTLGIRHDRVELFGGSPIR